MIDTVAIRNTKLQYVVITTIYIVYVIGYMLPFTTAKRYSTFADRMYNLMLYSVPFFAYFFYLVRCMLTGGCVAFAWVHTVVIVLYYMAAIAFEYFYSPWRFIGYFHKNTELKLRRGVARIANA